jgi:HAD domain in Swiss Army Knife RNA repair proteins
MNIFLDIDGVLRSSYKDGSGPRRMFEYTLRALRSHGRKIQVIISSSWRENMSLEELRLFFSSDIAPLIVGITPVVQPHWSFDIPVRYEEIRKWLYKNGCQEDPWIAIDDRRDHFPLGLKNLLWIDPQKLFDARASIDLQNLVRKLEGAQ